MTAAATGFSESRATSHESRGVNRQAILTKPRHIELTTQPVPDPAAGEVLVRVRAALTCGTDLKTYRFGHPKLPFGPFGHECAGDVAAVGRGVAHLREGDAVVPMPTAPCGRCDACRRGWGNLCERQFDDVVLGAYADYLLVSGRVAASQLVGKPSTLAYVEAAFVEPLACVVHAWNLLGRTPSTVAVVGLGAIGLLHVMVARARGVRVVAVGRRTQRLELAHAAGADVLIDTDRVEPAEPLHSATGGAGPDLIIECSGNPVLWTAAPGWAARGGQVLFFAGLPKGTRVEVDPGRMHYDEIQLLSAFHFGPDDVEEARALLASGDVQPRALVSGLRPLTAITDVFQALDRGEGIKYAILPGEQAWV
ncbi:MAG TPA: zinc-binding dehydrogenase [bacterium]|nr:zinc-binding dehydrogenase [bacterium]